MLSRFIGNQVFLRKLEAWILILPWTTQVFEMHCNLQVLEEKLSNTSTCISKQSQDFRSSFFCLNIFWSDSKRGWTPWHLKALRSQVLLCYHHGSLWIWVRQQYRSWRHCVTVGQGTGHRLPKSSKCAPIWRQPKESNKQWFSSNTQLCQFLNRFY